jgi:hypothetical protein
MATLDELIPIIKDNLAKGDAARLAYYQHLGGLLLEAKAQLPPEKFWPWLRRQIKIGRFGMGPTPYRRLFALSLEEELIEALAVAAIIPAEKGGE